VFMSGDPVMRLTSLSVNAACQRAARHPSIGRSCVTILVALAQARGTLDRSRTPSAGVARQIDGELFEIRLRQIGQNLMLAQQLRQPVGDLERLVIGIGSFLVSGPQAFHPVLVFDDVFDLDQRGRLRSEEKVAILAQPPTSAASAWTRTNPRSPSLRSLPRAVADRHRIHALRAHRQIPLTGRGHDRRYLCRAGAETSTRSPT